MLPYGDRCPGNRMKTRSKKNTILRDNYIITIKIGVLIPIIFAGISILTFIISYIVISREIGIAELSPNRIIFWGFVISLITFAVSYAIMRIILGPVERFVKTAENLPVMHGNKETKQKKGVRDDIERYNIVFKEVTDFLGKVESRQYFPEIIGESRQIRGVLNQVMKVAPAQSTVLIVGESGTGKELLADAIHRNSNRKSNPLIKMNCVAIPEGILESELFGHEQGAFTGAVTTKKGKFEAADGGTVFLDEIGDMSLQTQAKLLRVIQEREFERVGSTRTIKVDVRFIAATNKDLTDLVKKGLFREDLFYRLNVLTISIPPLRYRREDIPLLADHFLATLGRNVDISIAAMSRLMAYTWPGNVRELQNVIERAALMTENGKIMTEDLPEYVTIEQDDHKSHGQSNSGSTRNINYENDESLDDVLGDIEKTMIEDALEKESGVQKNAALRLGIKERSLWHRIKKYDIQVDHYR